MEKCIHSAALVKHRKKILNSVSVSINCAEEHTVNSTNASRSSLIKHHSWLSTYVYTNEEVNVGSKRTIDNVGFILITNEVLFPLIKFTFVRQENDSQIFYKYVIVKNLS